jgi:hypothetical protein
MEQRDVDQNLSIVSVIVPQHVAGLYSQEKPSAVGKRAATCSQPFCRDPWFPTVCALLKVALLVMKFQSAYMPSGAV